MTLLLIGCGRMGSAMARGWRDGERVLAFDPGATLPEGVERIDRLDALPGEDLVVVLAVKPQAFYDVAPALAPLGVHQSLALSIMAGVPVVAIDAAMGGGGRVVRAMPNTPAAVGRGVTGVFAAAGVSEADRQRADTLLTALGEVVWLEREDDLHRVTAVSGSGPAYFFRMAEALARAGTDAGLPASTAMRLARATLVGAAALAGTEAAPLSALREGVTSPGGTTAAGLALMDSAGCIDALMAAVVRAAAARSAELAR